ncbi:MAG: hypothetical protein IVW56_05105 [Candidatus Binataceae bacterium]|nr:hypothetical protein [Candidatus Binataceae bacterium]
MGLARGRISRWRGDAIAFAIAIGCALAIGAGSSASYADSSAHTARAAAQGTSGSSTHFVVTAAAHRIADTPGIYEADWTARRGPSPFDRIGLHRLIRGPLPQARPEVVVLYLPGTNMNGMIAVSDPRYSLPIFMAAHGVDFWTFDYRTHFIPPATPAAQLGELRRWNNELFESDIAAAARFVIAASGTRKIFIAGFSRGVSFAYLFAATHPDEVRGLMMFDGGIPENQPSAAPRPGVYADDLGGAHLTYDKRQALLEAVIRNPDGPAPIPQFKSARENLAHVVYASAAFGGHGGLANPQGGFSDATILARMMIAYDRYWPAVQDGENSFTPAIRAQLAQTKIPVIAFSSTNISAQWPARVAQSASATGSTDVTVLTRNGWGHLDVICGTQAQARVFNPALTWLTRHREHVDPMHRGGPPPTVGAAGL